MNTFTCYYNPVNGSAMIRRDDQPCLFLWHVVGGGMDAGLFQEKMGKVSKKLIRTSTHAMSFR